MKIDNIEIMPVLDEGIVVGITIIAPSELMFDPSKISIQENKLQCIFTRNETK